MTNIIQRQMSNIDMYARLLEQDISVELAHYIKKCMDICYINGQIAATRSANEDLDREFSDTTEPVNYVSAFAHQKK